jgi:GTPase SAR1 family protein
MSHVGVIRITILGKEHSGKLSLLRCFCRNMVKLTYTDNLYVSNHLHSGFTVQLCLHLSTPKCITSPSYFYISRYILFILDMSNIEPTYNEIVNNIANIRTHCNAGARLILVQTKSDITDISEYAKYAQDILHLCVDNDMHIVQTSSVNKSGIDTLFLSILNDYISSS